MKRHAELLAERLAIVLFAVVFLAPVRLHPPDRGQDPAGVGAAGLLVADQWRFVAEPEGRVQARDYIMVVAFINSTILTVVSVTVVVVLAAMVAFVLQRRKSRWTMVINLVILSGLIIPPAVVPTIWVLQKLGLFKTMPG